MRDMMNATNIRADAVRFWQDNFAQIFILMIPISIVWLGCSYLMSSVVDGVPEEVASALIDLVSYSYVEAAVIIYIRRQLDGTESGVTVVLREASRYALRLSILMAAKIVAIIVGLILLVVPGIIIAARLSLAEQVLVLKDSEIMPSLELSNDLAKPHFAMIFGSVGLLVLITSVLVAGIDYIASEVSEYLPLVLFPVTAAITSITTVAAYRVYSYVESERGVGA